MIWKLVANMPRNIDVACLLGEVVTFAEDGHSDVTDKHHQYQYTSTQPAPRILLVNRESRAVGLKSYALSFGSRVQVDVSTKIIFAAPANIWRNFNQDRICPMGDFSEDAALEFWWEDQSSCFALNAYRARGGNPSPLDLFIEWADVFLEDLDIFLYYDEEDKKTYPGRFEFVEMTEPNGPDREWEFLNQSQERLLEKFKPTASSSIHIRKGHNRDIKIPADWSPKITLVKLVLEGTQR
jgi:hypothetical protein